MRQFINLFETPTETITDDVRSWIAGSAMRQPNGKPVIFYHGTRGQFDRFEQRPGTISTIFGTETVHRRGFFFTTSESFAREHATASGSVMRCALRITEPLDLRHGMSMDTLTRLTDAGLSSSYLLNLPDDAIWELFDGDDADFNVDAFQAAGYDGALFVEEGHDVAVAFSPDQIKILGA